MYESGNFFFFFFFQEEGGIRDLVGSGGLGDVKKRELLIKVVDPQKDPGKKRPAPPPVVISELINKFTIPPPTPPTHRQYRCRLFQTPDFERMNEAAQTLFDYTDFTSFSKLHTDVKTNNCKIMHAAWTRVDDVTWVFTIQADRFLRNMVRAIVGTLLEVGRGKLSVEGFRRVVEQKDRCQAGTSVPGNALFLVDVAYPETTFLE